MTTKPDFKTWKDIPLGGAVPSGTSEHFHTGGWRSMVPVWQEKNCIHCMTCWALCPDNAITRRQGPKGVERGAFAYEYCKGCGICPEECPVNAKVARELSTSHPGISASTGHGTPGFDDKAAILFVGLKEAKEKFNIQ